MHEKQRKYKAQLEALRVNPVVNPVYNRASHQPLRSLLPI